MPHGLPTSGVISSLGVITSLAFKYRMTYNFCRSSG